MHLLQNVNRALVPFLFALLKTNHNISLMVVTLFGTEQVVTLNHSSHINIEESLMTPHFGKQSAQDGCVMEFSKAEKLPV